MFNDTDIPFLRNCRERVNLLKRIYGQPEVDVSDVAFELGLKKTDLMKNIVELESCFHLHEERGMPLQIVDVFLRPCDNPVTEEFREARGAESWVYVEEIKYYGVLGHYVPFPIPDTENGSWLNTEKTMARIREHSDEIGLTKNQFSFGEGYTIEYDFSTKEKDIDGIVKRLHDFGFFVWGIDDYEVQN